MLFIEDFQSDLLPLHFFIRKLRVKLSAIINEAQSYFSLMPVAEECEISRAGKDFFTKNKC
jgi:hypothetical protein